MKIEVIASTRKLQGTGASRRLRRANKVPGVIYGGDKPVSVIEIDHNPLFHAMRKEAFHASILDMKLDGASEQVLLRDYTMHAFKQQIQHIDFQRVDPKKPIHIRVPLHFLNAADSPAAKAAGAMISHVANDIEVACLPKDLPEFIEVDLKELQAGSSVHVADLKLPSGVRAVLHGKENPVVVTAIVRGKEEEVVDTAAPTAAEVPATAQKKPEAAAAAPAKDAKAGGDKKK